MKIVLTGGGTGGHFYPVIAVAEALRQVEKQEKLIDVELFYIAPQPYDPNLLFTNRVSFIKESAGKRRRYFSILNFFDLFITLWGVINATWTLYLLFPDVVFGKGGYVSYPVIWAARFLGIPVIIHESDSIPGRVNAWAGKFARRVAISYPQAADHFSVAKAKDRIAYTGNPVRSELLFPTSQGAYELLGLEPDVPVIVVLGGSQGSQFINDNVLNALPDLLDKYQVVHQTGKDNFDLVKETAAVILEKNIHKNRYRPFDNLDILHMRMAAGVAKLIISRAGSTLFEIAVWGIPSIIIPITDSNGDHQRQNAYAYARTGAAVVIEENNVTPHILASEVIRLMSDETITKKMHDAATSFAKKDAALTIAKEIVAIALEHEN